MEQQKEEKQEISKEKLQEYIVTLEKENLMRKYQAELENQGTFRYYLISTLMNIDDTLNKIGNTLVNVGKILESKTENSKEQVEEDNEESDEEDEDNEEGEEYEEPEQDYSIKLDDSPEERRLKKEIQKIEMKKKEIIARRKAKEQ